MIKQLQWDSDFFNLKVGKIIYDTYRGEGDVLDYDLIYVFSNEDFKLELKDFENAFSETKVIFIKNIEADNQDFESIFKFEEVAIDKEKLYLLAYESGKSSRFLLDNKFEKEAFKKLYKAWIDNSISKKFAEDIFVYFEENQLKGFASYKTNNDTASIGLIAVSSNHQGKGIGAKLLKHLENTVFKKGIKKLEITTQLSNIRVYNFYQKQGYSVKSKIYLKHYWKI